MKIIALALCWSFFIGFFASPAHAEDAENPSYPTLVTQEDARPLRPGPAGRIDRAIDGKKIRLQDGRIVELAGIDIPDQIAPEAKDFIDTLFADGHRRDVIVYLTPTAEAGRTTRMGHDLAHLVRQDGHVWVQGALIAEGLARAWPTPANPQLSDQMFALENQAIADQRGLWAADSPHRLMLAIDTLDSSGQMMVVEGTVRGAAMVRNVTYLNFGADWRSDFTVALSPDVRRDFSRRGVDVLGLQGRPVRVRGWVRSYNGPYMELEHPLLLQIDP